MHAALLMIAILTGPQVDTWREAQGRVALRYPQYRRQVYAMQRPTIGFKRGIFYDPSVGKDVYGSCVLGRTPEIIIGIVRDPVVNRDTIVHEYKHAITFRLPLSDKDLAAATSWIDRETGAFDQPAPRRAAVASRAPLNARRARPHASRGR